MQYMTKEHLFQKCNVDLTLENHVFCPFKQSKGEKSYDHLNKGRKKFNEIEY